MSLLTGRSASLTKSLWRSSNELGDQIDQILEQSRNLTG